MEAFHARTGQEYLCSNGGGVGTTSEKNWRCSFVSLPTHLPYLRNRIRYYSPTTFANGAAAAQQPCGIPQTGEQESGHRDIGGTDLLVQGHVAGAYIPGDANDYCSGE
ncbi:MAG TPA: hypothetical protein VHV57_20410 [Acidimicrobiales bacterium]|nr:hypothetical protein [Acidimicrobiales bacterium]